MKFTSFIALTFAVSAALPGTLWLLSIGTPASPEPLHSQPELGNAITLPTAQEIADAGRRTLEHVLTSRLKWTATHLLKDGANRIDVDCTIDSGLVRMSVRAFERASGQRFEVEVIETDSRWYVWDGKNRTVYRRGEAPSLGSILPFILVNSDFLCPGLDDIMGVDRQDQTGVSIRILNDQGAGALRNLVEDISFYPPGAQDEQLRQADKKLHKELQRGFEVTVDRKTGVIVSRKPLEQWEIHSTVPIISEPIGDIDSEIKRWKWEDHTASVFNAATAKNLIQGYVPFGGPESQELMACIFDPATGELRRIPVDAGNIGPGCFSKDRSKIYVLAGVVGIMNLIEIDLVTGSQRILAPNAIPYTVGHSYPALSPDGNFIALVVEKEAKWAVMVVDLKQNTVKEIGRGFEHAAISWAPDGKSLIGWLAPEAQSLVGAPGEWIIRMDMDGKVAPIARGRKPILTGDGETIIYMGENDTQWWYSCKLDGTDIRRLESVEEGTNAIATGPEGQEMIAIRYPSEKPPAILTVIGTDTKTWKPLPRGLMTLAWR